jgi:hypothetical protein
MNHKFITTLLAVSTLAVSPAGAGILDDWGKPALTKQFFMEYRIKFHQEGTHITSITLDRKGKESGNAWFHGGECYALMMDIARGPGTRVNFDKASPRQPTTFGWIRYPVTD